MPRYVYSQESGTDFMVNTDDKCDAYEDTNEIRQVVDDLGELLGHTKFDDAYPADGSAGGTLDYVKKNNFTSTGDPTSTGDDSTEGYAVGSRWINTATDTEYVCLDSSTGVAVWEETTVDTFLDLTDTPADFSGDANKILRVDSSSGAVEFVSATGLALDGFGTPTTGTTLDATTGVHGLLPIGDNDTTHYMAGDISWVSTTGIVLDSLTTPTTGTALDSSTGRHGLLIALDGNTSNYLRGDGTWVTPPGAGDVYTSGAFTVGRLTEISTTGGVIKASPFTVTTGDVFDFGAHSAVFTEQAIATTTGTAAINWNSGLKALFTRSTGSAGAVTFSFTAPVKSANLMLTIKGSTGGSTGTITWPTVYWQGGSLPTLTGTASAIDVVSFYYSTGLTAYLGLGSANFSTI